jgi:hypothetical protein
MTVLFICGGKRYVNNHNICSRKEERSARVPANRGWLPGARDRAVGMRLGFYHRWRPSDHGCPILFHRHPGKPGTSHVTRLAGGAESDQ